MNTDPCADCGDPGGKYFDPRDPPLENLLCPACLKNATAERIGELEFEVRVLKETLRKATP